MVAPPHSRCVVVSDLPNRGRGSAGMLGGIVLRCIQPDGATAVTVSLKHGNRNSLKVDHYSLNMDHCVGLCAYSLKVVDLAYIR